MGRVTYLYFEFFHLDRHFVQDRFEHRHAVGEHLLYFGAAGGDVIFRRTCGYCKVDRDLLYHLRYPFRIAKQQAALREGF